MAIYGHGGQSVPPPEDARTWRDRLRAEIFSETVSGDPFNLAADAEARDPTAAEIEAAIPRLRRALEAHHDRGGPAALALALREWRRLRDERLTGQGRRLKQKADLVLRMALAQMQTGDSP